MILKTKLNKQSFLIKIKIIMKILSLFAIVIMTILFASCFTGVPKGKGKAITHQDWTVLLKKHVNDAGFVNYKGFIKDSSALNKYLEKLSSNAPANSWSKDEKFAYWINAYNAFTVKLIVSNYPVKSIKELGANNPIIFVNTAWDKKFFSIDGKMLHQIAVPANSIVDYKRPLPFGVYNIVVKNNAGVNVYSKKYLHR